jgi:sec-independent protein translocase protein TatA
VLFGGKGKVSDLMGDVAKGIKSFKKGLSDDDTEKELAEETKAIEQTAEAQVKPQAKKAKG